MKYLSALALTLGLCFFTAALPAVATPAHAFSASPRQQASGGQGASPQQQQQQQTAPQQQQQQQAQTFTGTMVKKSGQYVFVDDANKATRKLDHQQALSKYQLNGKKVEILGTLDAANNTIHIMKIALIRGKA